MSKQAALCLLLLLSLLAIISSSLGATDVGIAYITPTVDHGVAVGVAGYVKFTPMSNGRVQVSVNITSTGLKHNSPYAIHVHNYGDLTDQINGLSTGEHFVGIGSKTHGCPPAKERHEGDMGNWTTNAQGHITDVKDFDLLLLTGFHSIIGRAVVLHEKFDNCSPPVGFAGNRLGVGVIGIKEHHDVSDANTDDVTIAVAVLKQTSLANNQVCNPGCAGVVYFKQLNNHNYHGIQVTAKLYGLPYNTGHGFHIYDYGDLSSPDGSSAGSHWNPFGAEHNLPRFMPRHLGDLGNVQSFDQNDKVNAYYQEDFSHIKSLNLLVGRSIVVHKGFDHGRGRGCNQGGDSGDKIMWGVIGIANPATAAVVVPNHVRINNTYVEVPCP